MTNCAGDGSAPFGSVALDDLGNICGTTFAAAVGLFGIVLKVDPKGNETVLYRFTGPPSSDGANPGGTLLRDAAGNLYGTDREWRFAVRPGDLWLWNRLHK